MICTMDIEEQLARVIGYSQELTELNTKALADKWREAKSYYIEAWNGCIYESPEPITLYLSDVEKRNRFNEFIDSIDSTYDNRNLTEFLDWLTIEEVFDNHLKRDYILDGFGAKIPSGSKVSKSLRFFEEDEFTIRKIQDQLSMIIQEDKITGTLCLSVHPLDYLSISENTYHWRSCHALDGDYRSGNLQYMVDKSTIVCYLRGADNQKLPNFPNDLLWNSKKWRMLLFLSDNKNAMFAGRQYPFFSPSAMDVVQETYLFSMNKNTRSWTPWYNDFIRKFPRETFDEDNCLDGRYICIGGTILKTKSIIVEPKRPLFFNDLTDSSFYIPYYSWNRYMYGDYKFTIGDSAPCPMCGEQETYYAEEMLCPTCFRKKYDHKEPKYYCECCDRQMRSSETFFIPNEGVALCSECYETQVSSCERCEDLWFNRNLLYDIESKQRLCPCCRNENHSIEDGWLTLPF